MEHKYKPNVKALKLKFIARESLAEIRRLVVGTTIEKSDNKESKTYPNKCHILI